MNRFILISFILFNFTTQLWALYIPKNLKPFFLKSSHLSPAIASRESVHYQKKYVSLVLNFSTPPTDEDLQSLGIIKLFGKPDFFSAFVPYDNLSKLSTLSNLLTLKKPMKPAPATITGEEVKLYKTALFHTNYFNGQNVNIAIIDVGFYRYKEAINTGELPPDVELANFSTSAIDANDNSGSKHGTAVAEIVHEIAPNAKLHLIKIGNSTALLSAKDYCLQHDIAIINHSVGWFADGWGDGDGWVYNEIVEPLYKNNILWVNSAGNSGLSHYQAVFNNDGNNWHKFENGTTYGAITNVWAGETIHLILKWNAYSESADHQTYSDYDLYLYNTSKTQVAVSSDRQNPYYPKESLEYTANVAGTCYYRIKKYSASKNYEFQVFAYNHDLLPHTSEKSITPPCDGEHVLSVGAVEYSNWTNASPVIENFSSLGPSQGGLIKPDIVGIDGMTNSIYSRFHGTSASSPSVAAVAALFLSKQPYLSSDQLFHIITDNAQDIGPIGADNTFGHGKVNLNLYPYVQNKETQDENLIVAPTRIHGDTSIYYYGVAQNMTISLKDAVGRTIKQYTPPAIGYASGENKIDISDLSLPPGVYLLEFKTQEGKIYVKKIIVYSH